MPARLGPIQTPAFADKPRMTRPDYTPVGQSDVATNRRKRGRVKTVRLKCTLGRVADISATGLRVSGTGFGPSKDSVVTLEIVGPEESVSVQGKVVWLKRRLFRFEVGLEFTALSAGARRSIAEIARACGNSMLDGHKS